MEIERQGNRGKAVLVVLDEDLQLLKAPIPGTGKLGQVAVDGQYAYLEFRIEDFEPYIIIGTDTVYNWEMDIPGFPDYGFQTIILCKYDFINEEVIWTKRIGNVGPEFLRDMLIDSEGNLLIHGWTSSGFFTFTETDTAVNYQVDKPFLGKYSPDGELLWGILNTNQHGELFHSIKLDEEDNVYYLGEYTWPEYHIGDTILYNAVYDPGNPTNRGIIVKYDNGGKYQWVTQLDGQFAVGVLRDVSFYEDKIVLGGMFLLGSLFLGNHVYENSPETDNMFLWVLKVGTGRQISHAFVNGTATKGMQHVFWNEDKIINIYFILAGEDEIFGEIISSTAGNFNGFLAKVNLDTLLSTEHSIKRDNLMSIYPNPAKSRTTIYLNIDIAQHATPLDYSIYTHSGIHVSHGQTTPNGTSHSITLLDLPSGVYSVVVEVQGIRQSAVIYVE